MFTLLVTIESVAHIRALIALGGAVRWDIARKHDEHGFSGRARVRANIPPAGQCGLAALVSGTALLSRSKLRRVRLEKFSSCPGPEGGRPERLQIHRRFQCEKSVPEPSERRYLYVMHLNIEIVGIY
uniref:Uncharacterized protein n=1 Tax=Anopheles coluzzii TaxID=1518534 RepID=A0A8W7P199_ANOCL